MAATRCFRMRKHLNALHRQVAIRSFSFETLFFETQKTSHTAEEQAHFLRAQDQAALRQAKGHLDKLMAHTNKIEAHITPLPTALHVPTTVKSVKRNGAAKPEVTYHTESIPYIKGFLRQRMRDTPTVANALIARAEHIMEHLTDLQQEPYAVNGQNSMVAEWEAEIARMSKQEKEDRLKSLQYEEEAASARLRADSVSLVKKVDAMTRKGRSAHLDAPEKAANPFQRSDAGGPKSSATTASKGDAGVQKSSTTTTSKGADERTKGVAPTAPAKPPQHSLADLQKRLEEDMQKGRV